MLLSARLLGFRGNEDWLDVSDFVVHFTRGESAYHRMLSILGEGRLQPGDSPFGCARNVLEVAASQRSVCLSEIPLGFLGRLIKRRSLYGIGFTKTFMTAKGGAPVWYLEHGSAPHRTMTELINRATAAKSVDTADPLWRLTPFVDFPGEQPQAPYTYKFEWEREWRYPGVLDFKVSNVALLFIPEDLHGAARVFFADAERDNIGPNYQCSYLDPRWSPERIRAALESRREGNSEREGGGADIG